MPPEITASTGSVTKVIILQFATYSVFGLTYLGLALGYIPGLRMN
ncbi:hypothetical protein [aff. Roholtiella sp. LEGE 12411]|nr:hypothetical protein [aff. Roholtiella sp. LEGE 12411]